MIAAATLAIGCSRAGAPVSEPTVRVRTPSPEPAAAQAPEVVPPTRPRDATLPSAPPPAEVAGMLSDISPARLRETVDRLAAFGTRHTLSPAAPDRGIVAARAWIEAQMRAAGGRLEVSLDTHAVPPDGRRIDAKVDLANVVAVLPGAMPEAASRRYYVVAHYDSRNSDPMDRTGDAPGANDDGSGTALVIELARAMAGRSFDATIVFMATAGEEQGLIGARRHATAAKKAGLDVRAVLSNDIVGDPTGPDDRRHDDAVRVFSVGTPLAADQAQLSALRNLGAEWDSPSRQLARYVEFVASWHDLAVRPALRFRPDRYLRGGDHTAFAEQGFAAVRFTEMAERYDRQHQDVRTEGGHAYGDLPQHVDEHYLAGVARLDAAALAHLANAPSSPSEVRLVTADLAVDTTVRWRPSPEPDVAGYEVVWRETTAATWQHVQDAGKAEELVLALSKDDWHFGVRAYDEAGYRSPVTFAGPGKS
jgi:Zn-dependent M28 family amino/carboxypeptidase